MVPLQLVVGKPVSQFLHGGHLNFDQSVKFLFALTEVNLLLDENWSHEAASTNVAKLEGGGATNYEPKKKGSHWNTPTYILWVPERVPTARCSGIEDVGNSFLNFLILSF